MGSFTLYFLRYDRRRTSKLLNLMGVVSTKLPCNIKFDVNIRRSLSVCFSARVLECHGLQYS